MKLASLALATLTSRLIACSQLACVVLFGALLFVPWQATSPVLGAAFTLACAAFAIASVSIARGARGLVRLVFGAFALLAMLIGIGELWLLVSPFSTVLPGLQEVSSLELAVAIAALNGLLALYGNSALSAERLAAEELQMRVSAEQVLKATLEQRVVERTLELDDAQRVLHRMWWLGQQITLELDPRRVLDRFLEAVADVAQADGAALGLLTDHAMIGEQAECGAIRLRDVGDRLEKTVEHATRIELQRDLLPEPPHAMQHPLRVVELQCSLDDALLERRLEHLLGGYPHLQLLRGQPFRRQSRVAVEREQPVERCNGNGELEAAHLLQAGQHRREGGDEQPELTDADEHREQGKRTEGEAHEAARASCDGNGGNRERRARQGERRAKHGRRRLPGNEQQSTEQHDAGKLRACNQPGGQRGECKRRQLHRMLTRGLRAATRATTRAPGDQ